ncbi:flavodoxin-dependent (E)-4-hydroxy-3-methylbut-2-enyl-diphosphate synthase [Tepidimicrobium xylanilyticum]|uniref:4-hydroxy-3-methylbut-2-en-1-yl diphosphate synthase (flavodoxin) n=1 Tax=Tepidimicrobium xylanilyticum TaxID=1123352 RepID=A0A1H2YD32_9FIRM|nr:flavodoxin-dependent (E)-4-hydroxy-3-methylbut-2-enyl-diphosphate synthase [Tepidimicrobium xylanilyticum]GMG97102.1 4-hydroxy-3-methylbut-2-en-1-yl diphosphate synthase (flavodoxin) [Tepidimicrobium xylanilyticum]SDX02738.1 4-hydroxy-3-methylbut-2-en-1-yl diphosphate synthase [Tepidimicrobium xylanilyticum]
MERKKTKKIMVGDVAIGGDSPITVQSMTNTITKDINATIKQIKELEEAGCNIIRSAITDSDDAKAIREIKKHINIPFIADIQYDYRLAIEAVKNGADCLRINPGNIGSDIKVKEVISACKERKIPIRIGVNSGSIKQEYLNKYNGVNANSMVESALEHVRILERMGYDEMKISLKASNVLLTIEAYKKISKMVDYPLHLGVTEAGPVWNGTIKSAIGMGSLLSMGIGDTIRVSLTGYPVEEVRVGREILRSLGLLQEGVDIISCPTCGRTRIDLIELVKEAEERFKFIKKPLKVAIMGCAVNGPGEAKEADIGIAGGKGEGLIFKKGKVYRKVKEELLLDELLKEIEDL